MTDMINSFLSTLPFTVTLTWTVILLIEYKRARAAGQALFWFALTCCLLYFAHAVHFLGGKTGATIWIDCLYSFCHLAVYPLFYIYIRLLTEPQKLKPRELWIIVPAIIVAAAEHVAIALELSTNIILNISDVIFITEIILTFIFAKQKLSRFNRQIENSYADTEEKTARSVQTMFYILIFTSLTSATANIIGRDYFIGKVSLAIPSILFTALIFSVLYVGYKQVYDARNLYIDFNVKEGHDIDEDEAEAAANDKSEQKALMERIDRIMGESLLFCRPGLKVSDLAEIIGSNRTYVSTCINKVRGESFSEFINSYRIEYVKRLLSEDNSYTITEIGTMAGFSSDSSLFRNFKFSTGLTPKQWLDNSNNGKRKDPSKGQ